MKKVILLLVLCLFACSASDKNADIVNKTSPIPKIEDGLKPVQRRVLYTMNDLGLFSNRPTKKSAKVTGGCLASYHPHGDTSVYDAMINMAQNWKKRYPLVFVQGNCGTVDGDPPAAARYTEARLTKLGESMLKDINKNTVDMVPNYDDSTKEPVILPSLFINVLCNGSECSS